MQQIKELVEQFKYNLKDYTSWNFNETNTRQQFIDKFFELLGRDVNNHFWRSEQYKEVVLEDKLKIWWQAKAPDYSFRLGGRRIFFVEAKKPSVNIKDDVEPAYQIRRYSWTAKLPIGILTDFEELAIYDTRVKPNPKDKAGTARIKYFTFEEFEENRERIYNTLSKEAVEKWALDKYVQEGKKKWTQSVDIDFLNMIDDRRDALAKNIYLRYGNERNRDLDRLNNIVGDIVDKIIFLRIAEDKKIENSWNFETIANGKEIWKHLISYFEASDKKYNSWLFDNTEIFKKFELDDKILKQILHSLYYPACPYEFSVLWVDILGNIYEKFLGKTLVKEWRTIKTEFKPDVKKAWGVFYTPQYIVDYIVKNTVGELLKWKTPKQALELNIVDPACGSGAFLIWAYDYILNRFLEQHTLNDETIKKSIKEGKIYQFKNGYHLSFAYKKEILKNMIYGVDIDRQAVAVSRLSLLLKLLEWETAETANQLFSTIDAALLPKLNNNIKCGNSLIDNSIYANLASPDEATIKKINAFDWEKEFAEVFGKWGFDAIIGNPPYVFTRDVEFSDSMKKYFQERYFVDIEKSTKTRGNQTWKANLYWIFIWKWLNLLNKRWLMSFIVPNTILRTTTYESIRKYLLDNTGIKRIVDLKAWIFDWATVSTIILILTLNNKENKIEIIDNPERKGSIIDKMQTIDKDKLYKNTSYTFNIFIDESSKRIEKMDTTNFYLWELVDVSNWIATFSGKQWIVKTDTWKNCKKLISGKDIWKYHHKWNWSYIEYILKDLQRARDERIFLCPEKLIMQRIWGILITSYDNEQYYTFNSVNNLLLKKWVDYSLKYILWLLNSKILKKYYVKKVTNDSKLTVNISKTFLDKLPIPKIDFSNLKEKEKHDNLVSLVDQMLLAQKRLKEAEFEDDKKVIEKQIEIIDGKINDLVFDLYGLSEGERKVVLNG